MLGYQKSLPAHPLTPKTTACWVCGSAVAIAISLRARVLVMFGLAMCQRHEPSCKRAKTYVADWAWLVGVTMISGTPA